MKITIQGNKKFTDYAVFRQAMGRILFAMRETQDKNLVIFSAGPQHITNMAKEFFNISSDTLRSNGIKTKIVYIPPKWILENLAELDELVYFAIPKEPVPPTLKSADAKGYVTIMHRQ
jgi:hypothetical protein